MPIDKRSRLRYQVINSCFANRQKRYWSVAELLDKFRNYDVIVERRTLERDFEAMRHDVQLGYHAPIVYNYKDKSFYYSDPDFTIDKFPLTPDDLHPFRMAINILQQYKGLDFVKQFEGVVDKLGKIVDQLDEPNTKDIIDFEDSPYFKGIVHVGPVSRFITNKQPVRIKYEKFDRTQNEYVFHPYFLKEYLGRWYVFGYSEARHYGVTLGLDRIEQIDIAPSVFKENKSVKRKDYFKHTIGVTVGRGPVEDIELWFSTAQAPYIKTKHLHHTQRTIRDDENGLVISLKLRSNPELIQIILTYGAQVKVISPVGLQNQVKEVVGEMMGLYKG